MLNGTKRKFITSRKLVLLVAKNFLELKSKNIVLGNVATKLAARGVKWSKKLALLVGKVSILTIRELSTVQRNATVSLKTAHRMFHQKKILLTHVYNVANHL